jgi:hypothetical protein
MTSKLGQVNLHLSRPEMLTLLALMEAGLRAVMEQARKDPLVLLRWNPDPDELVETVNSLKRKLTRAVTAAIKETYQ